jgi:hypothetical protein
VTLGTQNTYCCLVTNSPPSLNYSACQITNETGEIDVLFDFSSNNNYSPLNMSAGYGNIEYVNGGSVYTACGTPLAKCNGITITESPELIHYAPSVNISVVCTISISNQSQTVGEYVLFLPGEPCSNQLFIVLGNQIPNEVPVLILTCPNFGPPMPNRTTSVININNLTGLNIPTTGPRSSFLAARQGKGRSERHLHSRLICRNQTTGIAVGEPQPPEGH